MHRADDPAQPDATPKPASRLRQWGARLGVAGFVFFLVKGLLWLIVPALVLAWQSQGDS